MTTWPIGAREEKCTLPAGMTLAELLSKPSLDIPLRPFLIIFLEYPVKSDGEIQLISSPQYNGSFVDGVPPPTMSPICESLAQAQFGGTGHLG